VDGNDLELYNDGSGNIFFNLDKHCEEDKLCVGAVMPFKDILYFDKHKEHPAGFLIGYSIIVTDHPVLEMYCVFSIVVDHVGEIAFAGSAKLDGGSNTFLVTAASGEYEGEIGGEVEAEPIDLDSQYFLYKVNFLDAAL